MPRVRYAPLVLALLAPLPALAARCDLNGQEVNTDNGSTTAGKTGILKCYRDGKLWREQERMASPGAVASPAMSALRRHPVSA